MKLRSVLVIYRIRAISKMVGLAPGTLSSILYEGRIPRRETIKKLAAVLGVSAVWLWDDDAPVSPPVWTARRTPGTPIVVDQGQPNGKSAA
jgi:transcriptional regulator with XRE-family HTH domain